MLVELNRIAITERIFDDGVILLFVVNNEVIEMIVELIRQMCRRVDEMDDRGILLRCLELECIVLLQVIIEGVGIFPLGRMAYLNRIAVPVNRIHGQVERVNGFTVVMRRVNRRYARSGRIQRIFDVLVVTDGVIYTGGRENTVVEAIDISLADMLIQMYVERICITHFPFNDTVACKSSVVMDERVVRQIFPGRDSRNGIHVIARFLVPCIFVRPEELNRVAFTQTVLILRYMRLVRTHDDMQRVHFVAVIDDRVT